MKTYPDCVGGGTLLITEQPPPCKNEQNYYHSLVGLFPLFSPARLYSLHQSKIDIIKKPGNGYEWDDAKTRIFKENMLDTWDREEEPIPPERTAEELGVMLSKGECTIAYANAPQDVRAMCRLCINENCPGPYMYGDWEEKESMSNEVERAMKMAQTTKPKHLKIKLRAATPP